MNGVTPSGAASVDQSKLPDTPGTLTIGVRNVNLPDGTPLTVALDGSAVATLTLSRGQAKMTTPIPRRSAGAPS